VLDVFIPLLLHFLSQLFCSSHSLAVIVRQPCKSLATHDAMHVSCRASCTLPCNMLCVQTIGCELWHIVRHELQLFATRCACQQYMYSFLLDADPTQLPGIGRDASESSLMNSIMGNAVYVDQSSSQRALSPEDIAPAMDTTPYHSEAASLEEQLAHQQGLHTLHVQQPSARLSREISLLSDTAQNTCLPGVGGPERKSLGEDSVNDYAAKPDETMDDILRFFLKVTSAKRNLPCH